MASMGGSWASGSGDLLGYAASLFKFMEGFRETTACNLLKNAILPAITDSVVDSDARYAC